ncbi:MAG: MFS transporter [Chloroflexi bacterium]|nr:MFS transporter [Chloroflexota bacterium]
MIDPEALADPQITGERAHAGVHASGFEPVHPDERLVTPAFVAVTVAMLAFFTSGGVFLPTIPRYVAGPLGGDTGTVGLAVGAFAISSLLMRPFAGRLADRRGRRAMLVLGSVIAVAATFGHLLATSLAILVAMRLVLGVGEALFFVAALAAATDLAPEDRRGEAISYASLAIYLGAAIGPLLGETIVGGLGFDAAWIAAGLIALGAIILSLIAPETLSREARAAMTGSTTLLHPRGIVPGLLVLCGAWGMGAYFAFLPLLGDQIGLGGVSGYLALFAVVVVGLRIVGAKLPDRIGAARLSGTALIASATGLTILGAFPTEIGIWLATVVFATGTAFVFPAIMSLAVVGVEPAERGSIMGTAGLFVDAAFGLSPALLGLLAGPAGYGATFLVSAVFALVGAGYLLARRPGSAGRAIPA